MNPVFQFILLLIAPPAIGFLIAPILKRHQDAARDRQRAEDEAFFNRNKEPRQ